MEQEQQMAFIYELFDAQLPRLGPGDDFSTQKALNILLSAKATHPDNPEGSALRVLDIGCGNGAQTIALARLLDGTILAVDNHQPYLDELQRRAATEGVSDKIRVYLRDMCDLGLEKGRFDLIWSEGALYFMGFRRGLQTCRDLLKPHGVLAVSEITWLRPDPPAVCTGFFANEYPDLVDIDANLVTAKNCGYDVVGHFVLPESAWFQSYYHPLETRLVSFRKKYATDPQRMELIDEVQLEIDLYRKYSSYYGYVFYLMKRC